MSNPIVEKAVNRAQADLMSEWKKCQVLHPHCVGEVAFTAFCLGYAAGFTRGHEESQERVEQWVKDMTARLKAGEM
jgi:hypothetical protein